MQLKVEAQEMVPTVICVHIDGGWCLTIWPVVHTYVLAINREGSMHWSCQLLQCEQEAMV